MFVEGAASRPGDSKMAANLAENYLKGIRLLHGQDFAPASLKARCVYNARWPKGANIAVSLPEFKTER